MPNIMAVSGARIVPPIMAAMPTSAQMPVSPGDTKPPNSAPRTPPMMSSGASTPPEVPEPRATDQMMRLDDQQAQRRPRASSPCSSARDVVVADAESVRLDQAADADD